MIVFLCYAQIERHWTLFSVPELTLEKLQLIATSNASPSYKVKWLKWMNSSRASHEARRFPPRLVNEDKLSTFLAKACWYVGVRPNSNLSLLQHPLL